MPKPFSEVLRLEMDRVNVSERELMEQTTVPVSQIRDMMAGRISPTSDLLRKLARGLPRLKHIPFSPTTKKPILDKQTLQSKLVDLSKIQDEDVANLFIRAQASDVDMDKILVETRQAFRPMTFRSIPRQDLVAPAKPIPIVPVIAELEGLPDPDFKIDRSGEIVESIQIASEESAESPSMQAAPEESIEPPSAPSIPPVPKSESVLLRDAEIQSRLRLSDEDWHRVDVCMHAVLQLSFDGSYTRKNLFPEDTPIVSGSADIWQRRFLTKLEESGFISRTGLRSNTRYAGIHPNIDTIIDKYHEICSLLWPTGFWPDPSIDLPAPDLSESETSDIDIEVASVNDRESEPDDLEDPDSPESNEALAELQAMVEVHQGTLAQYRDIITSYQAALQEQGDRIIALESDIASIRSELADLRGKS